MQHIAVNLRTETVRLVPFAGGGGKSCFDLKTSKIFRLRLWRCAIRIKRQCLTSQEHYRMLGSGFGSLAMDIGPVALPLAGKVIVPAAKRIGKEIFVKVAPELIDIATRKKTPVFGIPALLC